MECKNTDDDENVSDVINKYRGIINDTPDLLSLLYDFDLLPEQIISMRGAISMAAVCEAYMIGYMRGKEQ